jgi:hypothetical protein
MKIRKQPQSVFFVGEARYSNGLSRLKQIHAENAQQAVFIYAHERNQQEHSTMDADATLHVFVAGAEEVYTVIDPSDAPEIELPTPAMPTPDVNPDA